MLNIVIFGPPGAGKGTQSEKLSAKYKMVHLSTGDILRAERKAGTPLGVQAQDYINKGLLVPDELVAGVLENEMNEYPKAAGFIFDGFPRNAAQVLMLDAMLQRRGAKLDSVVALEIDNQEELVKRIVNRALLSGRTDDQDPSVVSNRLSVYESETAPVIGLYRSRGQYSGVYGMNSIEQVFDDLSLLIDNLVRREKPIKKAITPSQTKKSKSPVKVIAQSAKKSVQVTPKSKAKAKSKAKSPTKSKSKIAVKAKSKPVVKSKVSKSVKSKASPKPIKKSTPKKLNKSVKKKVTSVKPSKKALKLVKKAAKTNIVAKLTKKVKKVAKKKAAVKKVVKLVRKAAVKKSAPKKIARLMAKVAGKSKKVIKKPAKPKPSSRKVVKKKKK